MTDTDQTTKDKRLLIASKTGKVDRVRELLADGADVNASDGYATALMYAAWRGHRGCADALLARGAEKEARTTDGKSAMDFATEAGHREIMELLFAAGSASPSLERENAARKELAAGADINEVDPFGCTRLLRATVAGEEGLVSLLLQSGADVHAATRFGHTAIMLAVYNLHKGIIEKLFAAGATLPPGPLLLPARESLEYYEIDTQLAKWTNTPFDVLWERRRRVEVSDLSVHDLDFCPFWELCADEDGDSHIRRPVPFLEPFDYPLVGTMRAELTLADGTVYPGKVYCGDPESPGFPANARPELWSGHEWIEFDEELSHDPERMAEACQALGRSHAEVFPVNVRASVRLKGHG